SFRFAHSSSTRWACATTRKPMGVTPTSVPPRSNRTTPNSSSSLRMATDKVGWLTKHASAARPKWRSRATATMYLSSVSVIGSPDLLIQELTRRCGSTGLGCGGASYANNLACCASSVANVPGHVRDTVHVVASLLAWPVQPDAGRFPGWRNAAIAAPTDAAQETRLGLAAQGRVVQSQSRLSFRTWRAG